MVLWSSRGSALSGDAPRIVLILGESPNDSEAIRELLLALRPDLPTAATRRRPLVLIKDREKARARANAVAIAALVRAEKTRNKVAKVFAHQDCDALEPSHLELGERIEKTLKEAGVDAIAVTPAWELEAWWFLWPDAAVAHCPSWRRPKAPREKVGLITNAKEVFRRALRPAGREPRVRDYVESDGPGIAAKVRSLGLIGRRAANSDSFEVFAAKVRALDLAP